MGTLKPRCVPAVLLALLVMASAAPVHAAPPAPQDLQGTYDAATQSVTLAWTWSGTLGAGDHYRVYIDGAPAATTTATTYEDDVSGWMGGVRVYEVAAFVGGEESPKAGPVVVNGYLDVGQCTPDGHMVIDPGSLPPGTAPDEVVIACLRPGDAQAPYNLTASYDPTTDALTLSWLHADPGAVSVFRVYADDALLGETTATSYTDDLSGWDGSPRMYHVAAVIDGAEHASSRLTVLASPDLPWPLNSTCDVAGFWISPSYPFLDYALYPECLPSVP